MTIAITGINHTTSSVELREKLAFSSDALPKALKKLKAIFSDGGCVILSTCNRVEIYARAEDDGEDMLQRMHAFLAQWHGLDESEFSDALYSYTNRDAVAHLFRVASSIDSMVVGEVQILGQVHDAFLLAQQESSTDKIMRGLFQRAFKVAKEVRTKSSINEGKVSVASVAVDLAVSIFTDLDEKTVLVIGSGETAELGLKSLIQKGASNVIVMNRSLENAETLAGLYGGEAVALDDLNDHLHRADIVITSTGSTVAVLNMEHFQRALRKRNKAPMFVIDIAVPRDVEQKVNNLDNVYLYDMDGLQAMADENMETRRAEVDHCLEIVEHQVDVFIKWLRSLRAEPTIVSMTLELNTIRERELEKTLQTLSDLNEKQRAEVEYMSKRIVNNILQRPMSQIKEEVSEDDSSRVLHLVKRLFGLEENH